MSKILIIDDDELTRKNLMKALKNKNYVLEEAKNGVDGLKKYKSKSFDMCILDVMMPFKDGFTLAKEIRNINYSVPIIFLTAKSLKYDVIKGFKIGADDYIIKPFDSDILLLKIKSLFKRDFRYKSAKNKKSEYKFSKFIFDSKLRQLSFKNEKPVTLSPKESDLLELLLLNMNDLTQREAALIKIWKDDNYFTSRSMDVYITKIRKYLSKDPSIRIDNIHGKGFKLTL